MIQSLKTELKLLLAEDIEKSILKFKELINPESNLFDEFVLMLGRYNDIKSEYIKNTVPLVEKNIELAKIRGTLIKLINELTPNDLDSNLDTNLIKIEAEQVGGLEEMGILEINSDAINEMNEISSLFNRLTGYLEILSDTTTTGTRKIDTLKKSNKNPNQVIVKKIIDEVGKEMIFYSEKAEPEVILFKQLAYSSIEKATKLVELSFRDNLINDVNDLKELRDTMKNLRGQSGETKLSMLHYKTTTEKLPNLTTLLSRGKKKIINNTDKFINEINSYLSNIDKFIENLELTIIEIES